MLATAVCGSDKHIYQWDASMAGMVRPPRIYGHEFCGEIVAFGPGGKRPHLEEGQYVSAEMHVTCGACRPCRTGRRHICENTQILGVHGDGCFAQYVVVPAFNVVPLDRDMIPPKVGAFLDALGNAVHTTQVADLSGKSVAVLGYGPIGAMCAEIARISGAARIAITEVNGLAAAHARRWAKARRLSQVSVSSSPAPRTPSGACARRRAAAPTSFSSSRAPSRRSTWASPPPGRARSSRCSASPADKAVTIRDYTNDVVFKGLTIHAIIGRRSLRHLDQDDRPLPGRPRRRVTSSRTSSRASRNSTRRWSCSTTAAR